MLTYSDYEKAVAAGELLRFLPKAIQQHMQSEAYRIAADADEYDRQRNVGVNNYVKFIAEHSDNKLVDFSAANNRISSNFFHRLNTQRATYSLGNGISFTKHITERVGTDGKREQTDETKARLGDKFDTDFYIMAYNALKHRECFGFWNLDRLYVFPLTEFVPLYDERTGALRAGIRFWRLAADKPVNAVLYAEDGYTAYVSRDGTSGYDLIESEPKRGYVAIVRHTDATGDAVAGYENYSTLPIIRMKGSRLYQSTLIGMREQIDSYDLIQSGFANDLQDCAQIYWIVENCGGMSEEDLRDFLNKLTRDHVATADTRGMGAETSSLKPYVQEVPFQSRTAYLQHIRGAIYEAFGALDVTNMSASARTATEIDAAYQPMDENADDFEYCCIEAIQQLLAILGIDDMPTFKRNRISNQYEQTQMVMLAANYLSDRAVLNHLPWIAVDERDEILMDRESQSNERFGNDEDEDTDEENDEV